MMRLPIEQGGVHAETPGAADSPQQPIRREGWVARPTDPRANRHYRGTLKLTREAQDMIDATYEEWARRPVARDTVG
jgi:hypothetical protein